MDERAPSVKVWDGPTRVFHWLLALAFLGSYVTHWLGINYFQYHVWCGYTVLVLVVFRFFWGVFGTRHARFASFVREPRAIVNYMRTLARREATPRVAGHNPLGALMVLLLLVGLLIQASTGLFANDEIFNTGPLYAYIDNELSLRLTALHQQLFYWLATAVVLHILAVLFHLVWKRENLITAMFTGQKTGLAIDDAIASSRWGRAVFIAGFIFVLLAVVVQTAPQTSVDFDF